MDLFESYSAIFGVTPKPKINITGGVVHKLLNIKRSVPEKIEGPIKREELKSDIIDLGFLKTQLSSEEAIECLSINNGFDIPFISIYRGSYPLIPDKIKKIQDILNKFGNIHGFSIFIVKSRDAYNLRCVYSTDSEE